MAQINDLLFLSIDYHCCFAVYCSGSGLGEIVFKSRSHRDEAGADRTESFVPAGSRRLTRRQPAAHRSHLWLAGRQVSAHSQIRRFLPGLVS